MEETVEDRLAAAIPRPDWNLPLISVAVLVVVLVKLLVAETRLLFFPLERTRAILAMLLLVVSENMCMLVRRKV